MSKASLINKLETLCAIYSLPLKLGWSADVDPSRDTAYKYWRRLELLNSDQYDAVMASRRVEPNAILISFFRSMDEHFRPDSYQGATVCDVGSGYGFMTFWVLLSGAGMVYTVGDPTRIRFIERLYAAAIKEGLVEPDRMRFRPEFIKTGDSTLHPEIPRGTLDLVLLTDTLEHITPRILPSLASAAYNDLRMGGRFISKQQNTDSSGMRATLRVVWEQIEKEQTLQQRLDIILKEVPTISPRDAERLALRTRGLDRLDFYSSIERFARDATMPEHDTIIAPVDVELDVPCEGDTSISRVTAVFKKAGFTEIHAYPDLMSSRRSRFAQPIARVIPAIFLNTGLFDQTSVFVMRK